MNLFALPRAVYFGWAAALWLLWLGALARYWWVHTAMICGAQRYSHTRLKALKNESLLCLFVAVAFSAICH